MTSSSHSTVWKGDTLHLSRGDLLYIVRGLNPHSEVRMRLSIRAENGDLWHVDSLDLKASRRRKSFIESCARKFGAKEGQIEGDLLKILTACESKQEELRQELLPIEDSVAKELTPEEKKLGEKFLSRPDLLNAVVQDIHTLGVVGEDNLLAVLYLISISRKLPKPLSAILRASSGAGKSTLVESVEQLIPPEDVVSVSGLSAHALYYMDRTALKNRVLVIEEREGVGQSDYGLRLLQSKGFLRRAVVMRDSVSGRTRTVQIQVEGPVSILETTTKPINVENSSRCFLLYPDESLEQTQRVISSQLSCYSQEGIMKNGSKPHILSRHHAAQRLLDSYPVLIPFTDKIKFPVMTLRARREHIRFWSLVESCALLHQYQRRRKKIKTDAGETVEAIEASTQDYEIAFKITESILGPSLLEIPQQAVDLFDGIKSLCTEWTGSDSNISEVSFTRRDLCETMSWSLDQVRSYLTPLLESEYIESVSGGRKGVRAEYRIVSDISGNGHLLSKCLGLPDPSVLRASSKVTPIKIEVGG